MLDALHVVVDVVLKNLNLPYLNLNLPYLNHPNHPCLNHPNHPCLNHPNLPRPRNLIQVPRSLDRPGCVGSVVNHSLLLNMLDALHVVVVLDIRDLNPPYLNLHLPHLNLPHLSLPSLNLSHLNLLRPRNLNQVPCSLDLPGCVVIAVNRLPTFDMLNALHAVLLILPRNLNLLGSVRVVVNCSLLLDMLDALHVVGNPNQVPSRLNLPGSVRVVVNCSLLLDMLDALHAVVVVPNLSPKQLPFKLFPSCQVPVMLFLPHRVSPNVILAAFRCRLATISPAVWNAGIAEGTCRTDLRHWLLGHVKPNGAPSNLAAWTSSVPTVVPFIGTLR